MAVRIFYLTDNRPGNNAQTAGVALAAEEAFEAAGVDATAASLKVTFSPLAAGANWLPAGAALSGATKAILRGVPAGAVFVAAGRRQGEALRYLQSLPRKRPFCVQLMHPGRSFHPELLLLPEHDREPSPALADATLRLTGAPNLAPRLLRKEGALRRRNMRALSVLRDHALVTGVLVGGAVKGKSPARGDVAYLAGLAQAMGGLPIYAFSRRTPSSLRDALVRARPDALVLGQGELAGAGMIDLLAAADRFCVTADSVSMLSEACSTGAPVEAWPMPSVTRPKHERFVALLQRLGYLDGTAPPLDDAAGAAAVLVERYLRAEEERRASA